jgi:hypothetical protein
VQSLEVAEHVPATAAQTFVDCLVAHAPVVLFSAAVPGQGGDNHVNEQPYEYWRSLFADRGYRMYDFLRPQIVGTKAAHWYRYNTFLFATRSVPAQIESSLVGGTIRNYAPSRIDCDAALSARSLQAFKHAPHASCIGWEADCPTFRL